MLAANEIACFTNLKKALFAKSQASKAPEGEEMSHGLRSTFDPLVENMK
jgi:hypothetical protein